MEDHQYKQKTPFRQDECQRTITGMTPLKQNTNPNGQHVLEHIHDASTLTYSLAKQALILRSVYRLHSEIFKHTPITETMRARLRSFLMSQAKKQMLYRETCSLACTYIDLYFLREGFVQVEKFQILVIACLIIACKCRHNYPLNISYQVFNKEELLKYERMVIIRLNFNLNPITYYEYAQRMIFIWDSYVENVKMYDLKFSEQKQGVNCKIRRFYEQLDCVYMVLASLDFDIEEIVINLFYLHARMLNVYQIQSPQKLSNEQFCRFFYPEKDLFIEFYLKFLLLEFKQTYQLNQQIGCYLKHFFIIQPQKRQWQLKYTGEAYQKIRVWDCIQTTPKNCYQNIKQIICQIKRSI